MKKNKTFLFALIGVIGVFVTALILSKNNHSKVLNQEAVYTVVQIPNSCVLRVLNGSDAKEYWISGLSTKEVRKHLNQPTTIKGSIVRVDQLSQDKRSSMGISDDCATNPNGDSQIAIKIDEIKPIYSQQTK